VAGYIVRRCLYAVLILVGVNLLTFTLFFAVNSPDNIARLNIGGKRVTAEAIEKWKAEHGYDKPLWFNAAEPGARKITRTIFYDRSLRLFTLDFGSSDSGRDIRHEVGTRIQASLSLAVKLRSEYGSGVCLIAGSFYFVEAGTGRRPAEGGEVEVAFARRRG